MIKNRNRCYRYRFASVMHHAMTQVSLKRDIKQFKEDVEKAVSKKLLQLHMKSTFRPLKAGNITYREEDKALESLAFLKEKCNGSVKGQACADGRKQRP